MGRFKKTTCAVNGSRGTGKKETGNIKETERNPGRRERECRYVKRMQKIICLAFCVVLSYVLFTVLVFIGLGTLINPGSRSMLFNMILQVAGR